MRRRWLLASLGIVAVGGIVLAVPALRDLLGGSLHGEPFQDGYPLRYWLRTLRSEDPHERERAAHVLGQLGPASPDVVPALVAALGDDSYIVRKNAAEALDAVAPRSVRVSDTSASVGAWSPAL